MLSYDRYVYIERTCVNIFKIFITARAYIIYALLITLYTLSYCPTLVAIA